MRHLVVALAMALLLSNLTAGAGSSSPIAFVPGSATDSTAGSIAAVDTGSNAVRATMSLGAATGVPFGVAVSPDGSRVFVSNFMGGNVVAVDAKTYAPLATIPVGANPAISFPTGIAVDPSGQRVYVVTSGEGKLWVIDANTFTRIGSLCLGSVFVTRCLSPIPRGVAMDPKAPRAYVTNKNGGGTVAVVDTGSLSVTQKVVLGGEPLGIAVVLGPDGSRRLFVALNAVGQVAVLDGQSYSLIGTLAVGRGPFGVAFSPKDGRLYVANEVDGTVSVIDTSVLQIVGSPIQVGANPRGLSVTEDGKHVYVANWGSHSVSVIDTLRLVKVGDIDLTAGSNPIYNPIAFGNSVTPGVAAITVAIDIKPGGNPNTINLRSKGTVAVAILSSRNSSTFPDFDATQVDPEKVTLDGVAVKMKPNQTPMAALEDVNGDGLLDLVVHFDTQELAKKLSASDTTAVLEGQTFDGAVFTGTDTVKVIP